MNLNKTLGAFVVLGFFVCLADADGPRLSFVPINDAQDVSKEPAKQTDKDKKNPNDKDKKTPPKDVGGPPKTDIFDQSFTPRAEARPIYNPQMMGDLMGGYSRQIVTLIGSITTSKTVTTFVPNTSGSGPELIGISRTITTTTPTSQTRIILVPITATGSLKIAENESPRPVDRVFTTYNYFDSIQSPGGAAIPSINNSVSTTVTGRGGNFAPPITTTTTTTSIAGIPRLTTNLNREVVGFEKTFFDGNASIEVRMPLLQQSSNVNGFGASDVGDVTIVGKYAFINDRTTGNVLSGGLAITAPTGPRIDTIDGTLNTTYLQPWVGYIWNSQAFFIQAFHSVVIPTDSRDVTLLFNDVGFNYWLYRSDSNRLLNFIVPMVEAHVTTPLNHRDINSTVYMPDLVVMTGGVHLGLFRNTTLSFGVATPVTGPRVYNVEGFVQLNWRF